MDLLDLLFHPSRERCLTKVFQHHLMGVDQNASQHFETNLNSLRVEILEIEILVLIGAVQIVDGA